MQLKPIAAITVLSLLVASLLVSGCINTTSPSPTPTPSQTVTTPTPPADFSSYFGELWESDIAIVVRPLTKSTTQLALYIHVHYRPLLSRANHLSF
jgi:hypothetical protein